MAFKVAFVAVLVAALAVTAFAEPKKDAKKPSLPSVALSDIGTTVLNTVADSDAAKIGMKAVDSVGSVKASIRANADEWANFGKGCKCEETCVPRVRTICEEVEVEDEECKDEEKKTPVTICKQECLEGTTVVVGKGISGISHNSITINTDQSHIKEGKVCREVCKEDFKKDMIHVCKPITKEELVCEDVSDGEECEKVCTCNGVTVTTKQVPVISVTKGH